MAGATRLSFASTRRVFFDEKPSAYVNLLRPRDRYPLDPKHTDGVLGVMRWLLPSSLR